MTSQKYDHLELGQFIPLHYHYNMLNEKARIQGFKQAISATVKPGMKVLELGGGTGVLSFFAAQQAEKVWCVERNPELVATARNILSHNENGHKVEVIQADASQYLPPEPVDVVICEMIHVAMLREKQLNILHDFKQRYQQKFPGQMPLFVPEACIQAVQPVEQDFNFEGYQAPVIQFQEPTIEHPKTCELSAPSIYQLFSYDDEIPQVCNWDETINIAEDGKFNALRVITKNILAIDTSSGQTTDWHSQYMIVPLSNPMAVKAGDRISINFHYYPGDSLNVFSDSLQVKRVSKDALEENIEPIRRQATG